MKSFLTIIALLIAVGAALGQENWKVKNFDQWDRGDVEEILERSAWVKKQEVRLNYSGSDVIAAGSFKPEVASAGGFNNTQAARSQANTVSAGGIQPALDFTFVLRLRSSMAIRLALVRDLQLKDEKEKELTKDALEESRKRQTGLYQCPACADNYVVTLTAGSRENKNYDPVYTAFSGATLTELKTYIILQNEKGEKRELVHFTPPRAPGEEAVFFFKRFDDKGDALFTPENKTVIFNATKVEVNAVTNFRIDVQPLVVGDKVDF